MNYNANYALDCENLNDQPLTPITSVNLVGRTPATPLVIEASDLAARMGREETLIVDVRRPETCIDGHIPGAVSLVYQDLLRENGFAKGLLPTSARLSALFSGIGLTPGRHVVAYDDDSGAGAARLLWTLDVLGHRSSSLLNGGFSAWDEADLPISETLATPSVSDFRAIGADDGVADYDYVLANLGNPDVVFVDARTSEEYSGEIVRAARGGHIPGAVNFNWTEAIDPHDSHRLRSDDELRAMLAVRGITADKEIVAYCQTHHRSSHTYIMLKHLGYTRVRGYAGSWSQWGNRADAPIER
ncbi:MAG: sulfurtransferase [Gammaproteobacteria bacterium]|nr:sulfurtransferase [Gammaproteobacteria bacterium]